MSDMIGVLPMGLFELVIAGQGLLMAVVIMALRSEQRMINSFLALYLLSESIGLAGHFFLFSDLQVPGWVYLMPVLGVLSGPAIYLYVTALTRPGFRLSASLVVHLLPLVFAAIGLFYALHEQLAVYNGSAMQPRPDFFFTVTISINLVLLGYVGAALWVLYRHRLRVESVFSSIDKVSLEWLKLLLCFMFVAYLFYVVTDIFQLTVRDIAFARFKVNAFVSALVIYLISIGAMRQPAIFRHSLEQVLITMEGKPVADVLPDLETKVDQSLTHSNNSAQKNDAVDLEQGDEQLAEPEYESEHHGAKYAKSTLTLERTEAIWEQLLALMEMEKPYLDNDLTLPELADMLAITPQILSQVVNTQAEESFYQFINRHRVEAAKRLMAMEVNRGRRMLEISEDAGFNSHSTFYNHFKKHEGVTPSKYRKTLDNTLG